MMVDEDIKAIIIQIQQLDDCRRDLWERLLQLLPKEELESIKREVDRRKNDLKADEDGNYVDCEIFRLIVKQHLLQDRDHQY